jgi:hypothetical protein
VNCLDELIKKVLNLYNKNRLFLYLIKTIAVIAKKTKLVRDDEEKISEFRYVMD